MTPPLSSSRHPLPSLLLAAALLASGCAATPSLTGADPTATSVASAPELAQWRGARFVLLGEVHDNAEQHRQRAELLRALLADGRPTRVL
ncbi:MAG TPA: ChaN family lipoprotein, partial [Ideonella sp.]|nr:ChaN family lipoprotein [Ideonella sp.]